MHQALIDSVFHPESPVTELLSLVGREREVGRAVKRLATHGGHVLISGNRGIGKTSIAKVAEGVLKRASDGYTAHYLECGVTTKFHQIAEECAFNTPGLSSSSLPVAPARLAAAFSSARGFLLLDEVDRLKESERGELSEFMKALSDRSALFSVCVVGIARTATDLFAGHLSVHRCLNEINVRKLEAQEIEQIVVDGFSRLECKVLPAILQDVAHLSRGYPSTAVLLCRHAAESLARSGRRVLEQLDFKSGLRDLLEERGTATQDILARFAMQDRLRHKQSIMFAAGLLERDEFTFEELLLESLKRVVVDKGVFENICIGFCINGPERIFDNPATNILRFSDPRVPIMLRVMEYLRVNP
jgi:Cdc6-like AAA superfamily ATPase